MYHVCILAKLKFNIFSKLDIKKLKFKSYHIRHREGFKIK